MLGILNYWRLLLLILVWFSGWGFACLSFIHAIKAYDVELSIQFFLRSMVMQMFLPTLLIAAVCLGAAGAGLLYWHPTWDAATAKVKPEIRRKTTRQLTITNIVK
jgi:hypothetical protein